MSDDGQVYQGFGWGKGGLLSSWSVPLQKETGSVLAGCLGVHCYDSQRNWPLGLVFPPPGAQSPLSFMILVRETVPGFSSQPTGNVH